MAVLVTTGKGTVGVRDQSRLTLPQSHDPALVPLLYTTRISDAVIRVTFCVGAATIISRRWAFGGLET
jgi:hypothetical protein